MWQCTLEVLGQTIRVRNKHRRGHNPVEVMTWHHNVEVLCLAVTELVNMISFIDVVANTYISEYMASIVDVLKKIKYLLPIFSSSHYLLFPSYWDQLSSASFPIVLHNCFFKLKCFFLGS